MSIILLVAFVVAYTLAGAWTLGAMVRRLRDGRYVPRDRYQSLSTLTCVLLWPWVWLATIEADRR